MTEQQSITFPFKKAPENGHLLEVAEGIFWLRMPLPWALNHINLWLLRDEKAWTIVDTGVNNHDIQRHWQNVFNQYLQDAPVSRIVVTHMHPDHAGLAGWLSQFWQAPLYMSRTEYLLCRLLVQDRTQAQPPESEIQFYQQCGFNSDDLDLYRKHYGSFSQMVGVLPSQYRRLQHNDELHIDGHRWRVLIGQGHSPEHVCLYCTERQLLLGGDQLLPNISSNVSVYPMESEANPLQAWLDSCYMLLDELHEDTLVLPAHGKPFRGAHRRLQQLIDGHEKDLQALHQLCASPKRTVDTFPALFRSSITDRNRVLATGEAQAHINCLLQRGLLQYTQDEYGVFYYLQV